MSTSAARGASADAARCWPGRQRLSVAVRVVVLVVPFVVSVATGVAVSRVLPRVGGAATLGWWVVVLGASTLGLVATERGARRFLPLAALLRLTLVFPDRAPSRLAIALRSGSLRRLRAWAREAATTGVSLDAARQAEMVLTLASALNAHDRRTRGHAERVRALSELVAGEMALRPDDANRLRWAALLHDIGKLTIPATILNKVGPPTRREWIVLRRHPEAGARIAGPLGEWLGDWGRAIAEHHERYDGTGYPTGLAGEDISLAGRIVSVTDAFETMTAVRSYNRPVRGRDARRELARCAGVHFDPAVVRVFLGLSLGRIHWAMGPLSWLAQWPIVGTVPRAAAQLADVTTTASLATGTVASVATIALGVGAIAGPGPLTPRAPARPPVLAITPVTAATAVTAPTRTPDSSVTSLAREPAAPAAPPSSSVSQTVHRPASSPATRRTVKPPSDASPSDLPRVQEPARIASEPDTSSKHEPVAWPGRESDDRSAPRPESS